MLLLTLVGCASSQPAAPTPQPPPTAAPFPTRRPVLVVEGDDRRAALRVTGTLISVAVAAHPTENWPAVGAVQFPIPGRDARRAFVRVYEPRRGSWSLARQLDIGESSLGDDAWSSLNLGITGDGVVHAIWGPDDAPWRPGDTPAPDAWSLWYGGSADSGATWGEPRRLAGGCWRGLSMATSAQGWVVLLAACGRDRQVTEPALLVRQPDGAWRAPLPLPAGDMPYLEGAVALAGDGDAARFVALLYSLGRPGGLLVASGGLAGGGVELRELPLGAAGDSHLHRAFRGVTFGRALPDGSVSEMVVFSWAAPDRGAFALASLDGGQSWGGVELIAEGEIVDVGVIYDPAADRLAAVWPCCGDTTFESAEATHHAAWSAPGSGAWSEPAAIVSGARVAGHTGLAQGANSRVAWMAWAERQQTLMTRSVDLNQIVPSGDWLSASKRAPRRSTRVAHH